MVLATLTALLVSLLIGGLALFIAAMIVHRERAGDYSHAIITALIGALVWALLAWIPLVGVLLALLGWIAVINFRYPGSWGRATVHAIVAWIAAIVIVLALDFLIPAFGFWEALGVPGV